jgi:ABC-type multidrug transport system fused ATPase/permease subunit
LFPAIQSFYRDLSRLRFNQPTLAALYADLYGAITEPVEIRTKRDTGKLALMKRVELRDAEYKYPGATRNAVNGLNISIDAFSTVGFVGTTGAGKTTAVDVILGLLELQKGALIVDGQDIGPSNRRMWQRSLGYVPQQTFLTDDTVAGNIALGIRPNQIDMAAVERAARLAELHNFVVSELPHGYDTLIGDSGARLSGGERQRICIARALYRNPEMLILDEATSALDNLTERAVMDAVQNLSHRKTILIIAHRLSTVRLCDKIYLFEHGDCVASGSYDELINNNSQFRDMDSTYR